MNARKILRAASVLGIGAAMVLSAAGVANAGAIYLTGHDVLLHGGQNGYDAVILDFLRGADPEAGYSISVVGSGVGDTFGSLNAFSGGTNFTGAGSGTVIPAVGTLAGYGTATYYTTGTGLDWSTILAADALVILSHEDCGGCDLTDAGSMEINDQSAAITTAFNAGMRSLRRSTLGWGSFRRPPRHLL